MAIVRECELKLFVCRRPDSVCMLYDCSLLCVKRGILRDRYVPISRQGTLPPTLLISRCHDAVFVIIYHIILLKSYYLIKRGMAQIGYCIWLVAGGRKIWQLVCSFLIRNKA